MSYLENGSTLRAMFRLMPPLRHDIDPTRSEVLAHIMENMRCDIGRAIRAFNSMRHIKSAVLVYDRIHRQWRGYDWVPVEETDKISMLMSTVTELKRDISSLRSEIRKMKNDVSSMRRRKGAGGRSRDIEEEEDEPVRKTEQQPIPDQEKAAEDAEDPEEWFRAMRAALDDADRVSSPSVPPQ
jgi:hypothetical protein